MAAHRSALEAVRQHTNDANILELEAAIEKIPHELLRPSPWHVCLENIIRRFKDAEQDRLLALFVGHGGQVNHVGRRLLLDNEIKTVGKFEVEPDEFDDTGEIAYKIAKKVLEIFPDSAWSQAKDTDRTVFHVAAETGACGIIELATRVIKENNRVVSTVIRQGEKNAQTALELAVEKERTAVVEKLLSLDQDQLTCHPNAERIITTAIDRGPISIVRALLHARPLLVTDGMFRKAIASGSIDILRFLTSLRLDLLQNSTFLHFAVKKGQVDIVEELIEQCPQLVEKYELEISTKIDRSVLYYNHSPKFKEEIRKIVVPVIIQRNAVSIIRELLADSSGREICLDLSAFTHDPTGLQQFLKLVKSQLSKREESSGDVIDEFLKTLTQSDRERFETFYKAFRANETMSALTNGLDGKRLGQTSRENSDLVNLPSLQSSQILQDNHIPPTTKQPSIAADALPLLDVEFEPTLKYVDLPCFDGIEASRREEVKVILDWLRESKNVGKIFHLVVTDSLHNPHSEETIEESVKYFDVEILDWRRIDLSIRTIRDAAPNVKRLHLYSSGNWAALDHWIGPDGVCTLQLLEYVRITIIEDHITRNRAKIYKERVISELTARCARKGDKWFHVVYDTWNPKQSRGMREALKIEQLKPTTITQLDYFLPKYQEIQEQISQNVDPASQGRVRGARIRVAILDSGVDPVLFSSQGRNIVGASFVHKSNGSKESPWWLASDPHGSHIANLVSQLDPCCDLYIAKVAESKNQLQLDQVVQAIEWAVAQRVDIINLSLVLFKYDAYLTNAINNARKEGIIIFCSTADNGNVVQDVWPAKYAKSHDCIFSVAACNAHGRLTEYSSETDAQYTFQGEDILASHGSGATGETERRVSGSSVATAIATGVASLVLACYRIMLSAPPHVVIRSLPTSHAAIIKNVFANMCNDHGATAERKTPLRVMPWLVFPTKASVVGARDWQKQDYTLGEPEDVMHWIIEKFQHTLSES